MFFKELVAQEGVKRTLSLYVKAYQNFNLKSDDVLLSGPSGVGKSTFARQFAKELNVTYSRVNRKEKVEYSSLAFFELNSQVVKNITDLFKCLEDDYELTCRPVNNVYTLPPCVIFIDEAHEMHKVLATQLLSATDEERKIDFKTNGLTSTLNFKNVVFILATTNLHDLERALINRFELIEMQPYTIDEIAQMVVDRTQDTDYLVKEFGEAIATRVIKMWHPNVSWSIGIEIGNRAKTVMRKAVKDLRNLILYCVTEEMEPSTESVRDYYEHYKGVDENGLDQVDSSILEILATGNSGINSIASRLKKTAREVEERMAWLEQVGCAMKAGGGRQITAVGLEKIGKEVSDMPSSSLVLNENFDENELIKYYPNGDMMRPTLAFQKYQQREPMTPEEKFQVKRYQQWYRRQREKHTTQHVSEVV